MEQLRLCDPEAEHADQLVQLQVSLMQDGEGVGLGVGCGVGDGVGVGFGVGDGGGIVVDDFGITIFRPFFNSGIKKWTEYSYSKIVYHNSPAISYSKSNTYTITNSTTNTQSNSLTILHQRHLELY